MIVDVLILFNRAIITVIITSLSHTVFLLVVRAQNLGTTKSTRMPEFGLITPIYTGAW